MPARRFGLLAGAAAITIAAAGAAQSPPANTLRVDLFAVRDGAAVDDLRQDELQLLEDGVPQTIDSFERVAVAIVRHDPHLDEAQIAAWCSDRLVHYQQPRSVVFVESLPRNSLGKVLRRELQERF